MRKLKLEMQVSVDGFAADSAGNIDWMVWNWTDPWTWDDDLRRYHTGLVTSSDCLLLSRKMAEEGFIDHWSKFAHDSFKSQSAFAAPIIAMRKLVFSKSLKTPTWVGAELVGEHLVTTVTGLKNQPGKDILVHGGPTFASSLVGAGLIDEFHLFVNPAAVGAGRSMFKDLPGRANLSLVEATPYACGVVVLRYQQGR